MALLGAELYVGIAIGCFIAGLVVGYFIGRKDESALLTPLQIVMIALFFAYLVFMVSTKSTPSDLVLLGILAGVSGEKIGEVVTKKVVKGEPDETNKS